jgi:hypothetical protein
VKLSILALVSTVSCIAAAAACGSSSNGGFPGGDSGTSSGGGDSGAGDGGTGSETGGSLPYEGELTATSTPVKEADGGANTVFTITGAFFPTPATTPTMPTCPANGTSSGSCCYIPPAVASDAGVMNDAGTVAAVSAGTITIKDGTSNIAALSPLMNGGGYAITSGTMNPSVTWTPGDMLSISAAGDTVQAFTGSLTTADDFAGVTPAPSTTATPVPLSSDFAISWTAGNGTNVTALLAVKSGTITCQVSDSAGTVSVPSALRGKLTTMQEGVLTLSRSVSTKVSGSNATVTLFGTTSSAELIKTM